MATELFTDLPSLGSILVTGGCGFLGSHIVSLLSERYPAPKTQIAVLDLHTSRNTYQGVTYHSADVTDASAVRKVLEASKPDVIIHTASPVASSVHGAAARKKQEEIFRKVNVEGTRVLLEEAKKAGVKVFVYTSSASVISDTRTDLLNANEKYELVRRPLQPEYYSDTKAEAEQLVLSFNSRSATPFLTTAIRPSAMFGEQDVQMIPPMLEVLRAGRTHYQLGSNDNIFDFTYVGNTAHGHILAATRLLELSRTLEQPSTSSSGEKQASSASALADNDDLRVDGRPFIITNHAPIYFWDFARAIWAAYTSLPSPTHKYTYTPPTVLGRTFALLLANLAAFFFALLRLKNPPKLTPTAVRYSCMTRYFDTGRAQRALGYRPLWTLDEGVQRTVRWFREREGEEVGKKDR